MLAACLNGRISHGTTALLYSHGMVFPSVPAKVPVVFPLSLESSPGCTLGDIGSDG
jgi:hypothetical protein